MAVVENAGTKINSSHVDHSNNGQTEAVKSDNDQQHENGESAAEMEDFRRTKFNGNVGNGVAKDQMTHRINGEAESRQNGHSPDEGFKRDMRELEDLLCKLNPMAQEFVPPSLVSGYGGFGPSGGVGYGGISNNFAVPVDSRDANVHIARRKRGNYTHGKSRMNPRTSMAQREEVIRRTVYVADLDQQITEEHLAALFFNCGQVVDCRICGDPNSVLRFAFVEFTNEEGARAAQSLSGSMLGFYPVRVLPSKTAIAPVNPNFLPRSKDELQMCSRTVYCTNIDKKVMQAELTHFFESLCGEVQRLRLLGDYHHSTRIAFVEFSMAESAIAALNCSGAILGTHTIRVSPSKTPVRLRAPQLNSH